jgi:A/G-specific adenine glycosylase
MTLTHNPVLCDRFLAHAVVQWQNQFGRHDLPWQNTRDPYRVWLSEIMLQQTQVVTVCDYYLRFLGRFPDVLTLANASLDDVLALWAGLGYYSRARNLHRCAQQVASVYDGHFPQTALQLETLPGIGRSTAAAIASLCFAQRTAILDGNVKRVLTRYLGFAGDLALTPQVRRLWDEATQQLPVEALSINMPRYTQGMMDLGASICSSRQPRCCDCPLASRCVAHKLGKAEQFPVLTRKLKRTAHSLWLLWAQTPDDMIYLTRRPTPGVWAGLYALPMFEDRAALQAALPAKLQQALLDMHVIKHVLTHKDLYLHPVFVLLPSRFKEQLGADWYGPAQRQKLGLPAPVKKLLNPV